MEERVAERTYRRAARLMEAEVDSEIIGLDRERGEVFGFNAVASSIWRLIATPRTLPEICAALEGEYAVDPATCRAETEELLATLVAQGLVAQD